MLNDKDALEKLEILKEKLRKDFVKEIFNDQLLIKVLLQMYIDKEIKNE